MTIIMIIFPWTNHNNYDHILYCHHYHYTVRNASTMVILILYLLIANQNHHNIYSFNSTYSIVFRISIILIHLFSDVSKKYFMYVSYKSKKYLKCSFSTGSLNNYPVSPLNHIPNSGDHPPFKNQYQN